MNKIQVNLLKINLIMIVKLIINISENLYLRLT